MSTRSDAVRALSHALDQTGDVLAQVHRDHLDRPTPCPEWDVQRLIDHLVVTPGRFLTMMRGQQPDWSAEPPHVDDDWAGAATLLKVFGVERQLLPAAFAGELGAFLDHLRGRGEDLYRGIALLSGAQGHGAELPSNQELLRLARAAS